MNNFTKEELEYLIICIYERPDSINPTMEAMRDKIQSLIDNYCEYNVLGSFDPYYCLDCKRSILE